MSATPSTASSKLDQEKAERAKATADAEQRKQGTRPKIDYYIPNMLRTIQKTLDSIEQSKEMLQEMFQTSEPKEVKEFDDRLKTNNEQLSKFIKYAQELREAAKSDTSQEFKTKLDSALKDVFEINRQFYILMLDCRASRIHDYFKLDNNAKLTQEILREVLHTIHLQIPDFKTYFKYKTKNKGSDYRAPIKWLSFPEATPENALHALTKHPDFTKAALGRERVLIAEFSKLSREHFACLVSQGPKNTNSSIIHNVFLYEKQCIIFFLKDFKSKTLDLHGFDLRVATEHAHAAIKEAFLDFKGSLALMSGQGKHNASGTSVIQQTLLAELKSWKNCDQQFIKAVYKDPKNPGSIKIDFRPPTIINLSAIASGISNILKNRVHRIVVKLDKKYPPLMLDKITTQLTMQIFHSDLYPNVDDVVIHFVEQSKVESEFIRLFFAYKNDQHKLFTAELDSESDVDSDPNLEATSDAKANANGSNPSSTSATAAGTNNQDAHQTKSTIEKQQAEDLAQTKELVAKEASNAILTAFQKVQKSKSQELLEKYKLAKEPQLPQVETALRRAAAIGDKNDLFILSKMVQDINAQDENPKNKRTALHWAAIEKHIDVYDFLISIGANPNIKDAQGKTAEEYRKDNLRNGSKALD